MTKLRHELVVRIRISWKSQGLGIWLSVTALKYVETALKCEDAKIKETKATSHETISPKGIMKKVLERELCAGHDSK